LPTSSATATASASAADAPLDELLPGYFVESQTGAWLTLPPFPLGGIPTIGTDWIDWIEGSGRYADVPPPRSHLTGDRWRLRPGQVNFILWWAALADDAIPDHPRWRFRSGVKRGAKGTGKDPLLALLALLGLCGPARPVWRDGRWQGEPHILALAQIAANSEDQAKDPLKVANAMVGAEMADYYGFDKGILRTQLGSGSRIEVLTSSEISSEGDPATEVFLNESHHMKEASGGQALAGVARRNAAKSPGGMARVLEFTNAHMPGEESVAEESFDAWQAQVAGRTRRRDILYDSREAPPHLSLHDEEQLMAGLRAAYADAPWVDLERIRDEAQDPRVPLADSIRYYFSSLPTAETAWVDPRKFDARARSDVVVPEREPVTLFLDCSKSSDATVLAGCHVPHAGCTIPAGHVMALDAWQRPHGDRGQWLAPRDDVDKRLMEVDALYDIQWLGVDPSPARDEEAEAEYWGEMVDRWHRHFRKRVLLWATPGESIGSAVAFDMRQSKPGGRERLREFTAVAEQTAQAIDDEASLTWDGNPILRAHVHNARRRPNQFGVSLGKRSRDSSKLVDYAVAMVGARLGLRRVLNSGKKLRRRRTGEVVLV
jgi:hypothetical protein